jgi:phospholipid/cholesterol/gamma-HCH transport system permease protein
MVTALGHWFNRKARSFLYAMGFFFRVLFETVTFVKQRQVGYRVLVQQILFTGVDALGVITLISLAIGAIIIVQGITILPQFGQGNLVYEILITIITREVGPLLTAFIVTARSGTAIATHLGGMVISHEIDAYVSVGINPISYLVVPRFLGVTISMILLTIYFNFLGLIGAFFVSLFIRVTPVAEYFRNLLGALKLVDIISSLVKSAVFGIIISTVATYQGFHVKISSTEIPQIVIKSVGQGFVLCILANTIITLAYYL